MSSVVSLALPIVVHYILNVINTSFGGGRRVEKGETINVCFDFLYNFSLKHFSF
jgi:hypothetical protein